MSTPVGSRGIVSRRRRAQLAGGSKAACTRSGSIQGGVRHAERCATDRRAPRSRLADLPAKQVVEWRRDRGSGRLNPDLAWQEPGESPRCAVGL